MKWTILGVLLSVGAVVQATSTTTWVNNTPYRINTHIGVLPSWLICNTHGTNNTVTSNSTLSVHKSCCYTGYSAQINDPDFSCPASNPNCKTSGSASPGSNSCGSHTILLDIDANTGDLIVKS
jgi:hypothetical protein